MSSRIARETVRREEQDDHREEDGVPAVSSVWPHNAPVYGGRKWRAREQRGGRRGKQQWKLHVYTAPCSLTSPVGLPAGSVSMVHLKGALGIG